MNDLTSAEVKRLRGLEGKATPPPWKADRGFVETPAKCTSEKAVETDTPYRICSNDEYDGGCYLGELRKLHANIEHEAI